MNPKNGLYDAWRSLLMILTVAIVAPSPARAASPEDIVRNGVLSIDESAAIGDVLDGYAYFGEKQWKTTRDAQKRTIVEFVGNIDYDKYAGAELQGRGVIMKPEMIARAKKAMPEMRIEYFIQFAIAKDESGFSVRNSGLRISGRNKDTGEHKMVEQKEEDLIFLKEIYENKPEEVAFMMLLSASSAPDPEEEKIKAEKEKQKREEEERKAAEREKAEYEEAKQKLVKEIAGEYVMESNGAVKAHFDISLTNEKDVEVIGKSEDADNCTIPETILQFRSYDKNENTYGAVYDSGSGNCKLEVTFGKYSVRRQLEEKAEYYMDFSQVGCSAYCGEIGRLSGVYSKKAYENSARETAVSVTSSDNDSSTQEKGREAYEREMKQPVKESTTDLNEGIKQLKKFLPRW